MSHSPIISPDNSSPAVSAGPSQVARRSFAFTLITYLPTAIAIHNLRRTALPLVDSDTNQSCSL